MDNLGYLLSDSSRLLRRAFDDRVRALEVTGPQAKLLLILNRSEGENQGYYADELEVEPITMCRMIDRMEDGGLVERRRDPADRRAWRLHLTERSRPMVARLRVLIDGLVEDMVAGVAAHDRETFSRVLTAIGSNLRDMRESKVLIDG